ncbi:MAG: Type secretion outer membrane protein TolC family [Chthoniobacteraceae bacterium]|nr:Type secretion outer membrane protein TolC family [Chthoniobacteraceae bacterium]
MPRRFLAILLLLGIPSTGRIFSAEIIPKPLERTIQGDLSLEHAVEVALRQNPEILRAFQEIERTRGQIIEVRGQALPHLTATGTYNQQDKRLLEGGGGGNSALGTATNADAAAAAGGASKQSTTSEAKELNQTIAQLQRQAQATGSISSEQLALLVQQLQTAQQAGAGSGAPTGSAAGSSSGGGVNNKSWNVTFQVRQVVYAGGQVRAALNIAKFTEDVSYWSLRDTVDRIISQTRTQFYTILLNRALITVQEESIRLLTQQLRDQQVRFEAGTVPRFNVLQAEVELSNVRPDLIRARNNYLIAQLQLAKTLGLQASPGGRPSFNVVGQLTLPQRILALNNALQLAKERRPSLKAQRQNILIETEQIKIALAGYKPRLDVNAGYEFRNSRLSSDLGDVVNGWFFGVTGSWDIFDGFETYGRTKQARARLQSQKINYDDSVQQVELEVQQAYANLQQASETIQSQQKGVEQAVESLRLATERFSAGAGTQLDVLNARVALTRAQTTELQARSDYNTALAEFDRATATTTIYNEMFHDPLSEKYKPKLAPAVKNSAKTVIETRGR